MGLWTSIFRNKKKGTWNNNITREELELCQIVQYDEELIVDIKRSTGNAIELIPEVDEFGEILTTKDEGLCSLAEYKPNHHFVQAQKERFKTRGYLLFLFENGKGLHYLATIKGHDDLDIIKWRQTSAGNFSLENKDLIARLNKWKSIFNFIIVDVGDDYFDLKPISLPSNIDKLAEEIYEFCPDIIDQGLEDITALKNELQQKNTIQLWWD